LLVELSKRFRSRVRELPKSRRREIARVIDAVRDGFGTPHLHSGLGIRRLANDYFECRVGLRLRLVFRARHGVVYFVTAGNHDEIGAFIKFLQNN
jgi:mRNA-degrading endonuclease YafQ of YafQ-DinJ toxin-antitoxin module